MQRSFFLVLLIICALGLVFLTSCSEDEECPTCPEPLAPTLANIWPNADGNSWTYEVDQGHYEWNSVVYDNVEDVPPLPSMDVLYSDLMTPLAEAPDPHLAGALRWAFVGNITTGPGVTAQRVEITRFHELGDWTTGDIAEKGDQTFLNRLTQTRSVSLESLKEGLGVGLFPNGKSTKAWIISTPTIFHGYAWEKNESGLVDYLETNTDITWMYANNDLSIGSEFSIPLSGFLNVDSVLHGRVQRHVDLQVGGVTIKNCVEMFYVFDFGVVMSTDEAGDPQGAFRPYAIGTIVYAPGIGPVSCHCRDYWVPIELAQGYPGMVEHTLSYFDVAVDAFPTGVNRDANLLSLIK